MLHQYNLLAYGGEVFIIVLKESSMNTVNIGFIGAGNMGTAILKGIAGSSLAEKVSLYAYDPDETKINALKSYGVNSCGSEAELTKKCKYVFLAVKPQIIEKVIESAAVGADSDTVFVSIAAGISTLSLKQDIQRCKDNSCYAKYAASSGEGASALLSDSVTEEKFALYGCFQHLRKSICYPKDKMKEIIAINGSSPAFIYLCQGIY